MAGTLLLLLRILDKLKCTPLQQVLFTCLLVLTPGFMDWTVFSLLETGFWCFLLSVAIYQLVRRLKDDVVCIWCNSLLIFLLLITRPESLLLCLVFIFLQFVLSRWKGKSIIVALAGVALPVIVYGLTVAALLMWRKSYFGYPLPNTYYAKVSADFVGNLVKGFAYLLKSGVTLVTLVLPFIFFALLEIPGVLGYLFRKQLPSAVKQQSWLLLFIGCTILLLPLYTGGDHFPLARFYQPLVPVLIMAVITHPWWQRFRMFQPGADPATLRRLFIPALVLYWLPLQLVFLGIGDGKAFYAVRKNKSPLENEFLIARDGRVIGEKLNSALPGSPSVGVIAAGGVAYTYKGPIVDLMGRNNVQMAHADKIKVGGIKNHNSFNKTVFYKQMPDVIVGFDVFPDTSMIKPVILDPDYRTNFQNVVLKSLYFDAAFHRNYTYTIIKLPNEQYFVGWISGQFRQRLQQNPSVYLHDVGYELHNDKLAE